MCYLSHIPEDPCLLIGGSSGQLSLYSIKRQTIIHKVDDSTISIVDDDDPNENQQNKIFQIDFLKDKNQVVALNGDQNAFIYDLLTDKKLIQSLKF